MKAKTVVWKLDSKNNFQRSLNMKREGFGPPFFLRKKKPRIRRRGAFRLVAKATGVEENFLRSPYRPPCHPCRPCRPYRHLALQEQRQQVQAFR